MPKYKRTMTVNDKEQESKTKAASINREQLINVLSMVKPGLSNSDIIEQSQHFLFESDKIRTSNGEIAITHKFTSGLTGAVSAKEFYNLFNKIPDESITAQQSESEFIFKGKKKQVKFNVSPEIVIPEINTPAANSSKWSALPENFSTALKACIFSASKNMTTPALTGILVDGDYAISCDNFRATRYKLKSKIEDSFLLPARAAASLINYNSSRYCVDSNWIHFINAEHTVFSARRLNDPYPSGIGDIFKVKGEKVEMPKGLDKALDRSKELVTEDLDFDKIVTLEFGDNTVTCCGQGMVGQYTEEMDCEYSGEKMKIMVSPALLMEIVKDMTEAVTNGNHLLFKGKDFEHVILLAATQE